MFDIGWSEMLVIGIVLIVVVGPKDLPRVLRAFGQTTKKMRSMAGEFQRQFNQAMDEAELSELRKDVDELRSLNPKSQIQKHLNPLREAADDLKKTMDAPGKTAVPAEPAKGAVDAELLDDPLVKAAEQNAAPVSSIAAAAAVTTAATPAKTEPALTPDPAAPKPRAKKAAAPKAKAVAKPAAPKKAAATAKTVAAKPTKPRAPKKKPASQTDESQ